MSQSGSKSSPVLVIRLAIMMFLQFFVWGAWYVAMSGFLNEHGMTTAGAGGSSFSGAAYTVASIAAILAPLTLGLIVDRFLNTEWVLAILNLIGAVLLWYAPSFAASGAPDSFLSQFSHPMIICLLAYMLCFMPTLGLTASLSFKHLANGEKEFPIVRVLGTIGWIAGGWIMACCRLFTGESTKINAATEVLDAATATGDTASIAVAQTGLDTVMSSIQYSDNSPHIFHAAAIASVLLGIYCLTLPRTKPMAKGEPISLGKVLGVDAWSMFKDKAFFVFAMASFLICIPLAGYYANGYGFVDGMGIKLLGSASVAMSTGQMSEIFFMLIMPLCFARLGVKKMLVIGMLAWVVRYGLWGFAFGNTGIWLTLPIFLGILLHGICYDFFFVSGMIYTDKKAKPENRGQAQALIVMLTQGLGLGVGTQVFVWLATKCTSQALPGFPKGVLDYSMFWYVPAAFALAVMLFFAVSFWDKSVDE